MVIPVTDRDSNSIQSELFRASGDGARGEEGGLVNPRDFYLRYFIQ